MDQLNENQVRTEIKDGEIDFVRHGYSHGDLKIIKKGLQTLHNFELMAVNIYRFQITKERSELNRQLISAMCNEMSHYEDFTVRLYEYEMRPTPVRIFFWFAGMFIGAFTRVMGRSRILKTGIWVEQKAVEHYESLLKNIRWDEDTRKLIEKDMADEVGHVRRWQGMLNEEKM